MIKKNCRIVIVTSGTLDETVIKKITPDDCVIGVDRAAFWLLERGVVPSIAVGDFDSCSQNELTVIKKNIADVQLFPPEKNFIDTELAVQIALTKNPLEIVIFGGLGSRIDHTLGVLSLLEMCLRAHVPTSIQNEGNNVTLLGRGRTILEKRKGKRYVSVIPVTNVIHVTLSGFKYDISDYTIRRGQTIGISNEFIGKQATIIIHSGKALIIQSRD